ncbi:MAG: transglycosylase SLT domain-containing protein [Brevinema sp.]
MKNYAILGSLLFITLGTYGQSTPLEAYRKGHYRFVVEQLSRKTKLSQLELYLLGQSQLELRRTNSAWETFNKINYESFATNQETSFLFPFFVDSYFTVGFVGSLIDQPSNKSDTPLNMVSLVPANHPIKADIDDKLLAFLWKERNYSAIMMANTNLSAQGKIWVELAKFAQDLPYNLDVISGSWKVIKMPSVYTDVLKVVDPKIITASQAKSFAEISASLAPLHSKALDFSARYSQLTGDKEFPIVIKYQILAAQGNARAAATYLYDHIKPLKTVSINTYRLAQSQLIRREMLDQALIIAEKAYKEHGESFSSEYNTVLEIRHKPETILAWYRKNYRRTSEELHNQVFRAMIRTTNLKLAEQAMDLGYTANSNFASFHLMYGLVKDRLGKKQEAYKSYLTAVMLEPFGYPGITARPLELGLRSSFRDDFTEITSQYTPMLTNSAIHKRLLYAKAFLLDDELKELVNISNLKADQKEHDALIVKNLEISGIPELEKLDRRLTNFAPEMQNLLENSIFRAAQQSSETNALVRYYYKYRSLFNDTDILGYLTFRLFFYLRNLYGNNTYIPIFSQKMLGYIYPKLEWDFILKQSNNDENLAYWMISSFHQESHFRKRVLSHVGAVGFAQVMGYTAQDIKGWMRRPFMENTDFIDNLTMGIYYHKRMDDLHGNNHVYGMAAYNAGPHRVKRWRSRYAAYENNMPLFIEAIDIRETRIYTRIVSYNRFMYELIDKQPQLWP